MQPWRKPWKPSVPTKASDLTYNGRVYLAAGDFGLTTIGRTYAIYYDMMESESTKLPDLYEMVLDVEKMADVATKMIDACWNYPGTAYDLLRR